MSLQVLVSDESPIAVHCMAYMHRYQEMKIRIILHHELCLGSFPSWKVERERLKSPSHDSYPQ